MKRADDALIAFEVSDRHLVVRYTSPYLQGENSTVYLALGTHREIGAAVLPFERNYEGSTVYLPFKADHLVAVNCRPQPATLLVRKWTQWRWSDRYPSDIVKAQRDGDSLVISIPREELGSRAKLDCAVYAKDLSANNGWGAFFGNTDQPARNGIGDRYVSRYHEIDLARPGRQVPIHRSRYAVDDEKPRIYQLFVRLFGNTNETRKANGTLAENGVGKFNDINEAALASLHGLGFSHIWLTGVLKQATATNYPEIGQPADDPDLLKGIAGSPYAIRDYFDVSADYAERPENRRAEFEALLERIHRHRMKALIDFVPNHVARSYDSTVRPELTFGAKGNAGAGDDCSLSCAPSNNFFYLQANASGPPLRLPTYKDGQAISPTCQLPQMDCDGLYAGEMSYGRVTGNNCASWTPGLNDWYETAKLNYGFDFRDPGKQGREYPNALSPDKPIPDTWLKMDRVIEHWQTAGIDGFRCDMAHMVPPEFWNWLIARARSRQPEVMFLGEAYNDDPAKVPGSDPVISKLDGGNPNVMRELLNAGFNAVYDNPTNRLLKRIIEGPAWANDLDSARDDDFVFHNSLRYGENHDEVRLAAPGEWAGVGMNAGPAILAILGGCSRGPVLVYNGQEVGEPGAGVEGFGGDDARTSIFDYWSMPELTKWVNGHRYDGGRLTPEQTELRGRYGRLLRALEQPAFREGAWFPLNAANRENPRFGRLPNESCSGHWLYGFLRFDPTSGQRLLVVVNLNPHCELENVRVILTPLALEFLALDAGAEIACQDLLSDRPVVTARLSRATDAGVQIGSIAPATALYLEVTKLA